jgi:hypothetical protein
MSNDYSLDQILNNYKETITQTEHFNFQPSHNKQQYNLDYSTALKKLLQDTGTKITISNGKIVDTPITNCILQRSLEYNENINDTRKNIKTASLINLPKCSSDYNTNIENCKKIFSWRYFLYNELNLDTTHREQLQEYNDILPEKYLDDPNTIISLLEFNEYIANITHSKYEELHKEIEPIDTVSQPYKDHYNKTKFAKNLESLLKQEEIFYQTYLNNNDSLNKYTNLLKELDRKSIYSELTWEELNTKTFNMADEDQNKFYETLQSNLLKFSTITTELIVLHKKMQALISNYKLKRHIRIETEKQEASDLIKKPFYTGALAHLCDAYQYMPNTQSFDLIKNISTGIVHSAGISFEPEASIWYNYHLKTNNNNELYNDINRRVFDIFGSAFELAKKNNLYTLYINMPCIGIENEEEISCFYYQSFINNFEYFFNNKNQYNINSFTIIFGGQDATANIKNQSLTKLLNEHIFKIKDNQALQDAFKNNFLTNIDPANLFNLKSVDMNIKNTLCVFVTNDYMGDKNLEQQSQNLPLYGVYPIVIPQIITTTPLLPLLTLGLQEENIKFSYAPTQNKKFNTEDNAMTILTIEREYLNTHNIDFQSKFNRFINEYRKNITYPNNDTKNTTNNTDSKENTHTITFYGTEDNMISDTIYDDCYGKRDPYIKTKQPALLKKTIETVSNPERWHEIINNIFLIFPERYNFQEVKKMFQLKRSTYIAGHPGKTSEDFIKNLWDAFPDDITNTNTNTIYDKETIPAFPCGLFPWFSFNTQQQELTENEKKLGIIFAHAVNFESNKSIDYKQFLSDNGTIQPAKLQALKQYIQDITDTIIYSGITLTKKANKNNCYFRIPAIGLGAFKNAYKDTKNPLEEFYVSAFCNSWNKYKQREKNITIYIDFFLFTPNDNYTNSFKNSFNNNDNIKLYGPKIGVMDSSKINPQLNDKAKSTQTIIVHAGDAHSYLGNRGYYDVSLERVLLGYYNNNYLSPAHTLNILLQYFFAPEKYTKNRKIKNMKDQENLGSRIIQTISEIIKTMISNNPINDSITNHSEIFNMLKKIAYILRQESILNNIQKLMKILGIKDKELVNTSNELKKLKESIDRINNNCSTYKNIHDEVDTIYEQINNYKTGIHTTEENKTFISDMKNNINDVETKIKDSNENKIRDDILLLINSVINDKLKNIKTKLESINTEVARKEENEKLTRWALPVTGIVGLGLLIIFLEYKYNSISQAIENSFLAKIFGKQT